MAASNAPEQNSVTTRDTLISTISTRAVLLGAYESTIIHRQSMEVGFDLTPIRHIILPFVRFVFFVVEIS